jgi:ABC-type antimicrobial peptide transport system permease subunit
LFGAGDFAHTSLILLATQTLTPEWGATKAASIAVALYVIHNVFYAGFAVVVARLKAHALTDDQRLQEDE